MKLVMISHYFPSHKGGVEAVADVLTHAFADKGHEVVWMAGDASQEPEADGRVRCVPVAINNFVENRTGVPFPIPLLRGIRTVLRQVRKADVLFLHDSLYLANILAYCAAKLRGKPIIIVQYTRSVPTGTALMDLAIKVATVVVTNPMLSHAEQVVFIGNIVMTSYSHLRFKAPPELIYCGINTRLFHPRSESETTSAIRAKHSLPEERPIVLYVGRFVRKKGLHAIKRMATLRPDWIWLLAGWGPIDPKKWGLDNVIALSGLDDSSIAELYRCSDLFILPSVGEGGFPLVAREALVSGLPVVCGEETRGADPGFEELATWAKVFVGDDDRTAGEFLKAIDRVLSSETEKSKMVERQAFAVSQFSWDTAIERYLEILSRLAPPEGSDAVGGESLPEKGRP